MKLENCAIRPVKAIGKDYKKRRETVVSRSYRLNNKHIVVNKAFRDYSKAMDEVVKCFGELGAYV